MGDILLHGNAELAGKVSDEAGGAVANADVRIAEVGRAVKTDAEGAYRLTGVPAGRQKVEVAAADCGEWQESRILSQARTHSMWSWAARPR